MHKKELSIIFGDYYFKKNKIKLSINHTLELEIIQMSGVTHSTKLVCKTRHQFFCWIPNYGIDINYNSGVYNFYIDIK